MSLDRIPGDAKLYIGGLFSLRRYEALKKANITHVVSALRLPLDQDLFKNVQHHVVDIDDVEDENIIQYFAASNAFITEGLKEGGGVLVHCAMGKSRSTAFVIAYLLSTLPRTPTNTPTTILALIRQTRPFAEPNPGFMSQLALYHQMNMPSTLTELDSHPEYQRWLYQRALKESNSRGVAPEVGEIRFADASPRTSSAADGSSSPTGASAGVSTAGDPASSEPQARPDTEKEDERQPILSYRCRRCRHQLATCRYVLEHAPGDALKFPAPSSLKQQSSNTTRNSNGGSEPCAHLFIEPLSWMRPELELGKIEGRLECPNPKCGTSVGRYAWQGLRCSCGAWVVPGVSLGRGKVDEVREVTRAIRRVPGGKM